MKTILTEERVQVERLIDIFIDYALQYISECEVDENAEISDIYETLVPGNDGTFPEFTDEENELFRKYHSLFMRKFNKEIGEEMESRFKN